MLTHQALTISQTSWQPVNIQGTALGLDDGHELQDLDDWRADKAQAGTALQQLDAAGVTKAQGAAHAAVEALMLTDAPLLYSPSLLALAALRAGFRKVESCKLRHDLAYVRLTAYAGRSGIDTSMIMKRR